jgi:cytochrome c553
VIARVRIDPEEARGLNRAPPPLSAEEREEIERRLKDYADELRRRPEVDDAVGALPVAAEDAGSAPARAKAERGEVEP